MADVFFKLTAEEKDAVNALLKVMDGQKKVESGYKSIRKASEDADKAARDLGKSLEGAGKAVADKIVPGLAQMATVAGAAGLAAAAIADAFGRSEKRVNAFAESTATLGDNLAKMNKLGFLPELEKQIDAIAKKSTKLTGEQIKGLTGALGDDAKKLSTTGLTNTIDFAVKANNAGQNLEQSARLNEQVRVAYPKAPNELVNKMTSQLLGVGGSELDSKQMLHFMTAAANGVPLEQNTAEMNILRKSGLKSKFLDKADAAMHEEVSDEDKKPKYEIRAESREKIERLRKEGTDDEERLLALDKEANGRKLTLHHQKKEREAIKLREEERRVETRRLEEDRVVVPNEKAERMARINKYPEAQRGQAWRKDLTLLPPELRAQARLYLETVKGEQAHPQEGAIESYQRQYDAMTPEQQERLNAANDLTKSNQEAQDTKNGKGKKVTSKEMRNQAAREKLQSHVSDVVGDYAGSHIGDFFGWAAKQNMRADQGAHDFANFIVHKMGYQTKDDLKVKDVNIKSDDTKIPRVVVSRNGGNQDDE